MVFSSALAKTFPVASAAMAVGVSEGSTRRTGPAKSLGVSAETQDWSSVFSSASSSGCGWCCCDGLGVFREASGSSVRCLRFLGLSPLKDRGLTILNGCRVGLRWKVLEKLEWRWITR